MSHKSRIAGLLLIFIVWSAAYGQNTPEIGSGADLANIARVNHGNSYITLPADIGNIEPLWFEANSSPDFFIRHSKDSRLMGVLTPQIIIRMYQERSFPVRTPSYIPQITAYYLLSSDNHYGSVSIYGKIAHHSNGQDGDFFLENGEVNLLSGDFATNFMEGGIIKTSQIPRLNAQGFYKASLAVHPGSWSSKELEGRYSPVRLNTAISMFKLPRQSDGPDMKARLSIKGEATWMFGQVNDWAGIDDERLNLKLTFYYHPKFLEDIGLFIQMYHGMDYYNIYFDHHLDVIRFGLMTEKLRF